MLEKHIMKGLTGQPVDPNFENVSLLLLGNGTNGAQNNTFLATNDAAVNSPGGFSAYFDGTGDYLNTPDSADFLLNGDFTVECWVYLTASTAFHGFISSSGGASGQVGFLLGNDGCQITDGVAVTNNCPFNTALAINTWYHVAFTCSGTSLRAFVNGVQQGSTVTKTLTVNRQIVQIGRRYPTTTDYPMTGYLSNARIIKGTALYTSNFTVPSAPLPVIPNTSLLACRYAALTATNSAADAVPGGFGAYFDGNGDYLTVPDSSVYATGTNSFTIECWICPTQVSAATARIISQQGTAGNWALRQETNEIVYFYSNASTGATINIRTGAVLTPNTWYHIAAVRNGNTFTIYVNGVSLVTGTSTGAIPDIARVVAIGAYFETSGGEYFNGYLSNIRFVNGTAVYTSNFTVPTAPLTAITNTSLLTCRYSTFIDGSTNNFTVTANGNAMVTTPTSAYPVTVNGNTAVATPDNAGFAITRNGDTTQGTFSPYGDLWSNYFDGTGDFLSLAGSSAFAITTSTTPFTIEAWICPTALGGVVFSEQYTTGGNSVAITISMSPSGSNPSTTTGRFITFGAYTGTTWVTAAQASTAVPFNTWTHVACVFTGSTTKIYYNGVDVTTGTVSTTWPVTGVNGDNWYIGKRWDTSATEFFSGYISNFRFVKGTAVYTSNFTPPTTPLTAISGTSLLTCQSNRFRDASSNNFAITRNGDVSVQRFSPFSPPVEYSAAILGGSGYFDGTGDYLSAASNAAFNPGAGAFTWECWFYPTAAWEQTSTSGDTLYIVQVTNGLQVGRPGTGTGNVWGLAAAGTAWRLTTTSLPILGQWNHMAIARSGTGTNQTAIFLNGSRVAQGTVTQTFAQGALNIMDGTGAGETESTGYIADMRFVNGSAVYDPASATYTVPTSPLTAVTNTSLLLKFTNAGVIDNAMMNNLRSLGNAQISTAQSKWGGSSIYFDGATDYLSILGNNLFNFGAADFTIEMWIYPTAAGKSNYSTLFTKPNASLFGPIVISIAPSTYNIIIECSSNGTSWNLLVNVSGGTLTASAWNHFAVARSGSSLRAFMNGTLISTSSVGTTALVSTTGNVFIGFTPGAANSEFTGYLDDYRVTLGVARYTANFTPPQREFPVK